MKQLSQTPNAVKCRTRRAQSKPLLPCNCARSKCNQLFTPTNHHQKYHTPECAALEKAERDSANRRAKKTFIASERECRYCPTVFVVTTKHPHQFTCTDSRCRNAADRDNRRARRGLKPLGILLSPSGGRGAQATYPRPKPKKPATAPTAPRKPIVETKPTPPMAPLPVWNPIKAEPYQFKAQPQMATIGRKGLQIQFVKEFWNPEGLG